MKLPHIKILWPTLRPAKMLEVAKIWINNAHNKDILSFDIATNTTGQLNTILRDNTLPALPISKTVTVGTDRVGVATATWSLTKELKLEPFDIVILASDDMYAPPGWDEWIISILSTTHGCLVVDDGHQYGQVVTLPIMTYGCLRRLGHIIYHPSYFHSFSDAELYLNITELQLAIDKRKDPQAPTFEHKHWACGKRKCDKYDAAFVKKLSHDERNFKVRRKKSIQKRLHVAPNHLI